MSDLFVNLLRYADEQENFFTECVAETLRQDPSLSRSFLAALLGTEHVSEEVPRIQTQVNYARSCVDMVIRVGDMAIGVEHKLWSPEGKGQLSKYLRLPLDRVAFVTGYEAPRLHALKDNPKYLRPKGRRDHFMWHDFFPLVERSSAARPARILAPSSHCSGTLASSHHLTVSLTSGLQTRRQGSGTGNTSRSSGGRPRQVCDSGGGDDGGGPLSLGSTTSPGRCLR